MFEPVDPPGAHDSRKPPGSPGRRVVSAPTLRRLVRWSAGLVLLVAAGVIAVAGSRARLEAPLPTLLVRDRHGRFLDEVGDRSAGGGRAGDGDSRGGSRRSVGGDRAGGDGGKGAGDGVAGEGGKGALDGVAGDDGFGYWTIDPLPPRVVAATLALEDRRFWLHPGVDPRAVVRSLWQNLSQGRRVSGASTLAMQVARMQRPGPRRYWRKGLEALTALLLTARYGRDAVLSHYLRIVPYGNRIHGIAYAARRYLDKPVEDLSWAETAFLTAIPQAPSHMNPFTVEGRARAVARGRRILTALLERGTLSDEEFRLAVDQIGRLSFPPRTERPGAAMHAVLRLNEMLRDPARRAALAGRPLVDATLDLDLQAELSLMTWKAVRAWEADGAGNAAVLVVDRRSLEVLAAVGSAGYFDDRFAGAIDYTRVPRFAGSTLKPFVYALALERGLLTPASILDDLSHGPEGVVNADGRYLGPLLARAALANSRNVPAVGLLARLGLERGFDLMADLELHDRRQPARYYGLGLAIGGMPVTLEQLVRAYTVLAGDGRLGDLVWYRRQPLAEARRVLSEDSARQISLFLSDPMARLPSFPRMGWTEYPFPVAVKTGTSNNYRDAWTIAWSSRYLVGVWVGHPDYRPMKQLSGYQAAAKLVHQVLTRLHRDQRDGLEDLQLPPPRGYLPARLCALTGGLATDACDRVVLEWFPPGSVPTLPCAAHVRRAIDVRDGLLATSRTPARYTRVETFTDLEPRYAEWQAKVGLARSPAGVSGLVGDSTSGFSRARWKNPTPGPSPLARKNPTPGPSPLARKNPTPGPSPVRGGEEDGGDVVGVAAVGRLRAGQPVRLRIVSPDDRSQLLRDPEMPAALATVALRVVVDPPSEQIVWYVDGAPYQVADYPYVVRWPVRPGTHTFQARVPYTDFVSAPVRVTLE